MTDAMLAHDQHHLGPNGETDIIYQRGEEMLSLLLSDGLLGPFWDHTYDKNEKEVNSGRGSVAGRS